MKNFKQNSRFGGRGRSDGNRGRGNRDFGPRSMHQATCAECGNACEVPFRPSGDKPVYCSNCFEKNKGSDFRKPARRDFGKSDYGSNQAFSAVCDKCGNACEVPFRPSGDKPVYCDDCFGKNRSQNSKNIGISQDQFAILSSKLDKIIASLNPVLTVKAEVKPAKKNQPRLKKIYRLKKLSLKSRLTRLRKK